MYTFKARSIRIDNIKVGVNTGIERTIAGGQVPPQFTSKWGNNENIAIGAVYGADENLIVKGTNLLTRENLTPPAHSLLMADATASTRKKKATKASDDDDEFETDDEADDDDETDTDTPKAKRGAKKR